MRIVTILGGPRKKGSTARVLEIMEDHFKDLGHKVKRINITDYDVQGCSSCYKCHKKSDELICSQKDDGKSIFEKMIKADVIVYSSPLYCWSWTAQIKPLIDRHYCLVKNYGSSNHKSFLENKKSALLVTCAGPLQDNADLLVTCYNHLMQYVKINNPLSLVIPFLTGPESITEDNRSQARQLAATLVS
jgi:multimeric flavodoxin WrbA